MLHADNRPIATLAAEHLRERGFRHFAYVGVKGRRWSEERQTWFVRSVEAAGFTAAVHEVDSPGKTAHSGKRQEEALANWLAKLPRPLGVMACYDVCGLRVLAACRQIDASVPEQVAVIGVDDDALLCELADPPLTSVAHDLERIGYEGAALLDQRMAGTAPADSGIRLINPTGVVARQSTDILAIDDRQVAEAIRFIREHACDGINVDDVLRRIPLTRVTLKRRFERFLGRSPKAEIVRLRLERVKKLLAETDFTLATIADLAGFLHPEYMNVVFKQKTGKTPKRYRLAVQLGRGEHDR